jgi:hypothetical protein
MMEKIDLKEFNPSPRILLGPGPAEITGFIRDGNPVIDTSIHFSERHG